MKTLIIDNYDSFTFILEDYIAQAGGSPIVYKNDALSVEGIERLWKQLRPTHIVISPGPGTPECARDVGITFEVIERFMGKVPILGVCLVHQAIGKYLGARLRRAPRPVHGQTSRITRDPNARLLAALPHTFDAMRYHSLIIDETTLPPDLIATAHAADASAAPTSAPDTTKICMAIEHATLPLFGVQFHPESIGTPHGMKIIKTFLAVP